MNPNELFDKVIRERREKLVSHAMKYTHHFANAEDAVQVACIQIWEDPKRLKWNEEELVRALFTAVKCRAIDSGRGRNSRPAAPLHGAMLDVRIAQRPGPIDTCEPTTHR